MIPVTYPSVLNLNNKNEMVIFPISDVTGLERWKDYIPVKFVDQVNAEENSHNNNAYKSVKVLNTAINKQAGLDYVPVYIDSAATSAWEINANGYIPVGISGASLSLQFAGATTLDPRITFSRASTATYTGSDGLIKTAAAGVPRFDHDPITGESKGFLIEEQRSNLLTYSEQFGNAAWTKGTRVTVNSDVVISPDGTLTADKLIAAAVAGQHFLNQGASTTSNKAVSFSFYAKAAEYSWVAFYATDGNVGRAFDLSNGTLLGTVGGVAPTSSSITSVGNGWYRCSVSWTQTTGVPIPRIYVMTSTTNTDFLGDGYSGIYIWGAQLEAGSFPTSYIPTVASQVTRSADSASMTGSNFSSWYRADEGTVYSEWSRNVLNADYAQILSLDDGSLANRISLSKSTESAGYGCRSDVVSNNVAQATFSQFSPRPSSFPVKFVAAYKTNDFAITANGAAVMTANSGVVPIISRLVIGNRGGSPAYLNGTIKRIAFWPKRLSNSELQGLTS